ncbi:MAG: CDP-alcohol phosphatidyltransferase family protein [Actinomycetota bacterium]|nr:CDP-alcohol phosphatidyltransferase family protein [Actinomycetota bacterium]
MLDRPLRRITVPALDRLAAIVAGTHVRPGGLTLAGLAVGLGAAVAAGVGRWRFALAAWLVSRVFDGLDGVVARRRDPAGHGDELGGYWDITADFTVYAAFVVGVAVELPDARLAAVATLAAYYVNACAFLAFSSIAERRRLTGGDERSLQFGTGLAEGTETILAYVAVCLWPSHAAGILWVWAAIVAVTAAQRVWLGSRALRATGG